MFHLTTKIFLESQLDNFVIRFSNKLNNDEANKEN